MLFTRLSKYLLAVLFILAGLNHFWHTAFYVRIMPSYLPWPVFLVELSGLCETALGILLLPPATTRLAARGLIALLFAVFPANLNMALHPDRFPEFSPLLLWTRVPLQALLVWWVYRHTTARR